MGVLAIGGGWGSGGGEIGGGGREMICTIWTWHKKRVILGQVRVMISRERSPGKQISKRDPQIKKIKHGTRGCFCPSANFSVAGDFNSKVTLILAFAKQTKIGESGVWVTVICWPTKKKQFFGLSVLQVLQNDVKQKRQIIGWHRLVGSKKYQVSFAKESCQKRALNFKET